MIAESIDVLPLVERTNVTQLSSEMNLSLAFRV